MKKLYLFLISILVAGTIFSQAGILDTTFDVDGRMQFEVVFDDFDVPNDITDLEITTEGAIRASIVGWDYDILYDETPYVFSANADGSNPVFSNCDGNGSSEYHDIEILPDGKFLSAGFSHILCEGGTVGRYNTDGYCDESFTATHNCDDEISRGVIYNSFPSFSDYDESFNSIKVLPDGKYLAAGNKCDEDVEECDLLIVKFNTDGSLDGSFGIEGVSEINLPGGQRCIDMALLPSGKFLIAGNGNDGTHTDVDFFISKFNANGTLNASFGEGGIVYTDFGDAGHPSEIVKAMAIKPDGKIILSGFAGFFSAYDAPNFALVQYLSNGELDNTFGSGGIVLNDLITYYALDNADMVLQEDGKIIQVGTTIDFEGIIIRYNNDGNIDESFGDDGYVFGSTLMPEIEDFDHFDAAAIHDGKLYVGGASGNDLNQLYIDRFLLNNPCSTAPSSLFATNITTNKAKLHWSADTDALKYKVQYRASTSPVWISLNATTNLKALTGLSANTTYKYRVRSQCSSTLVTAWSNVAEFTTLPLKEGELITENNFEINIYPNPNNGIFTLSISELIHEENISITIKNVAGEIVYTGSLQEGENEIAVHEISNGIYFITVTDGIKEYYSKILKIE